MTSVVNVTFIERR